MDSHTTFRTAVPTDSDFVYRTKRAAFKEYVERNWAWDEGEQRKTHERRFAEEGFRIVNVDGDDAGFLSITVGPDHITLNQLFLLPEYQGRGIGSACLHHVIGEAERRRLPIRLRVLKVNPRARAFYERSGFMAVGETEYHDLMEWRPT